jgi:prefoldin subunit 2
VERMTFNDQNPEEILNRYKQMNAECQQLSLKIQELTLEKDEHRLVIDTMSKLEPERRAFRLVGGILVERTVGEVLPTITRNAEGVKKPIIFLKF